MGPTHGKHESASGRVVVEQDALGGTIWVVELAAAERPYESAQAQQAQEQGGRDQIGEHAHRRAPSRRRRALPTTTSDAADMHKAATRPAIASGMVITL